MTNEWDNMADFWDDHEDVIQYSEKAFTSLCNTVDLKDKRILDFGSGSGLLTEKMASKADTIFAMDTSSKMISVLRNKNIPNVVVYDAELSIEFIEKHRDELQSFDIIVASSVCVFLPNYNEVLSLFKQLLKPDGIFVQWDWMTKEYKIDEGFDMKTISSSFNNIGFKVISLTHEFSLVNQEVLMAVGRKE